MLSQRCLAEHTSIGFGKPLWSYCPRVRPPACNYIQKYANNHRLYIYIYIYIYIGGWGERVLASPPQTGKSFRFVRACVRATDARFSYPMSLQLKKSPSAPVYFIFCPAWFPFCSWWWSFLLKFGFVALARIFYLWRYYLLSLEFFKRVFEESSWREFLKRVFEESVRREFSKESSWRMFLKRVLEASS